MIRVKNRNVWPDSSNTISVTFRLNLHLCEMLITAKRDDSHQRYIGFCLIQDLTRLLSEIGPNGCRTAN
jgi:hypothetical protein